MDTVDRIFQLVDAKYKEQREFAADIGAHPTRISEWRCRKSTSYLKRLPQIAEVLGTTVDYLLTGEKKEPTGNSGELREQVISQLMMLPEPLAADLLTLTPAEMDKVEAFVKGLIAAR